ncbi:hypothetical protein [Limosilactobacillus reuteri]|uniref:hypothetical protein n=1 Tax=Limosilactobacillus reuteri TaxID=1598 RepID=UPI0010721081|nr:hypothetical protein [Limosilactobacillus reuteri]MCH5385195.1 hypothetical protein [Limosilactobacillus reuteri]
MRREATKAINSVKKVVKPIVRPVQRYVQRGTRPVIRRVNRAVTTVRRMPQRNALLGRYEEQPIQ